MSSEITAIVPIRERSERLPRKNFRDFNGRPLYHWILETLEAVSAIDRIVVNTDAAEVIETAPTLFDVEISERPEWLLDEDTTVRIIEYEVERLDSDIYVQTYCTNPLLEPDTIGSAVAEFLEADEHDSLFSVTRHQKRFYDSDLNPINHDPYDLDRTQDLDPIFEDNANLYVYTGETIATTGHRIGKNPTVFEIGEIESLDIDVEADFEMAEYFHERRTSNFET